MLRSLAILLPFYGLSVALGRLIEGEPAVAEAHDGGGGGEETCAARNGDVNADGTVDLSDAVTVLGHLFLGSPTELVGLCASPDSVARIAELEADLASVQAELARSRSDLRDVTDANATLDAQVSQLEGALASCRSGNPAGLPDTGQHLCYDAAGTPVPCDGEGCAGQDGLYAAGCPSEGRFVDGGDGTVTDTCTGLVWQKESGNNGSPLPWCEALAYCESLELAGHDDWRLPNARELLSIVDYGREAPAIDPVFGIDAHPWYGYWYWSSTTWPFYPFYAWAVGFQTTGPTLDPLPGMRSDHKQVSWAVRAVRTGP